MLRPALALFALLLSAAAHGQSAAEVLIPGSYHAMAQPLRAWRTLPAADAPVPACLIVHGSGGLFKETTPGADCSPALEDNFAALAQLLADHGVASLAPSSFASRDSRFCEDNDDQYFAYAPPPFVNVGDTVARDAAYDMRRIVIRALDLLAAADHLCDDPAIDCSRVCLIGASNGGSGVLAYVANDLGRHLREFTDISQQREHESSSAFADRQAALAHFPPLPDDLVSRADARVVPLFAEAVSPGCVLRGLVPTVDPASAGFDPARHLFDLFYPAAPTELHIDIGTADTVPVGCYDGGIRETQARGYEALTGASPSRYRLQLFDGAGHDLLSEVGPAIDDNLVGLVQSKFFPFVFGNGFEGGAAR